MGWMLFWFGMWLIQLATTRLESSRNKIVTDSNLVLRNTIGSQEVVIKLLQERVDLLERVQELEMDLCAERVILGMAKELQ